MLCTVHTSFTSVLEGEMAAMAAFEIVVLLLASRTAAVKVLQFQGDGKYSTGSFVYSPPIGKELTNFILCLWFKVDYWRPQPHLFQLATENDTSILSGHLETSPKGVDKAVMKTNISNAIRNEFSRKQWNHICLVSKMGKGESSVYINGIEHRDNKFERKAIPGEAIVIFGQDQDRFKGDYDEHQAFSGWIADFGISENVLTSEEIARIAACKKIFNGDQISTENINGEAASAWEVSRMVEITEQSNIEMFCQIDSGIMGKVAAMKGGIKFWDVNETCSVMGGRLLTLSSAPDMAAEITDMLWDFFKDEPAPLCLNKDMDRAAIWLADFWSPSRGAWVDPFNDQEHMSTDLEYLHYLDLSLEGDQSCMVLATNLLYSTSCGHVQPCTYCTLPPQGVTFHLRGLCTEDLAIFDTDYTVHGVRNGRFYLRGTKFSHIYYEGESYSGNWILESLKKGDKKLLSTNSHPFGEREWNIDSVGETLTLSACQPDKFACNNGHCIPISDKCNSIPDCLDQSDEADCIFVQIDGTYLKDIVPRGREPAVKPLEVNLAAMVLSIVNIDTYDLKFTLDFALTAEWYDERLQYKDLNEIQVLNSVGEDQLQRLWTPKIMMQNSLGAVKMEYDEMSITSIGRKQENGTKAPVTSSSNALLFDGKENMITVTRRYFQDFSCEMDLMPYPFDTQVCRVMLMSVSQDPYTGVSVQLSALEEVGYHGPETLLEYRIVNMTFEGAPMYDNKYHRASLTVVLKRRVEYHLMNTFLQMLLLVAVSYATCFFEVENFTDKITVTLTTMLGLPKTSYYKLIDIWLLFTILIQVAIFVLHTMVGAIIDKQKGSAVKDSAQRTTKTKNASNKGSRAGEVVNFFGKFTISVGILGFNVIFWCTALGAYNNA